MSTRQILALWQSSSILGKAVVVLVPLIIIAGLVVGTVWLVNSYKDAAYEKREGEREAEREADEAEKAQLRVEKQKALTEAAEATAQRDIYKQVAESKRADRQSTIKELEQIEVDHVQRKAEVEASGGSLSDDDLRRALCERMAKRGFPPCPN